MPASSDVQSDVLDSYYGSCVIVAVSHVNELFDVVSCSSWVERRSVDVSSRVAATTNAPVHHPVNRTVVIIISPVIVTNVMNVLESRDSSAAVHNTETLLTGNEVSEWVTFNAALDT